MRPFAGSLAFALIASATVAAADDPARPKPSKADSAAAEALFEEGRKLLASGQVKQACPKFAESYRLDPALGSLLNLATCHQLEGKTASAWGEFRDAEQQARRAGDAKRQKFAAEKAASLEAGLPKLIVTVSEAPKGLIVYRDGTALGEGSFNVPLPVDPGERVVRAEAPGKKPWETRVEAVTGKRASVVIPELEAAAAPPEGGGEAPGDGDRPPPGPDAPVRDAGSGRTVGYVLGGVGLAGVAAGAVFGALFFGKKGDAEDCKAPACPRATYDDAKGSADTFGTVSGVALGVGAAALVAGAVLVLSSPSAAPPPAAAALTPWIGVSATGASAGASARF